MSENDAYLLEEWLIAKLKHNGVKLTNLTNGGEGGNGTISAKRKLIYCSSGDTFECGKDAAAWLVDKGYPAARQGHIASCCRGERPRAYGFAWSYDGVPLDDALPFSEAVSIANGKTVNCENGMSFRSCVVAAEWLESIGIEACSHNISRSANGGTVSAYGYGWWYDGDPPKKYIPQTRPVECIGYGEFASLALASAWVSENTEYKAQGGPIKNCANGKYKMAYGYSWRWLK